MLPTADTTAFWEAVLETRLEDWNGQGRSRQARVGRDATADRYMKRDVKWFEGSASRGDNGVGAGDEPDRLGRSDRKVR